MYKSLLHILKHLDQFLIFSKEHFLILVLYFNLSLFSIQYSHGLN